jgi:CheY-like chemotaxis protein
MYLGGMSMKIVLIEDDSQKAERITSVLEGAVSELEIQLFRSYQSGLKFLEQAAEVDLVVLDMSLPTFDPSPDARPGRPRPLGGYDLMRKLKRMGRSPAVVVLTALENFGSQQEQFTFEELRKKCAEEFPNNFLGAIYYSQSKTGWRDELMRVIEEKL